MSDPVCGCLKCNKLATWRGNRLFVVCDSCKELLAHCSITWVKIKPEEYSFLG